MNNKHTAIGRRSFLGQSALISLGFLSLYRCTRLESGDSTSGKQPEIDLTLKKDPKSYLDLPEDFEYRIISRAGQMMDDGFLVPGRADGMGAFAGEDGRVIVVRNHENSPLPLAYSPFGPDNGMLSQIDLTKVYDSGNGQLPGLGGTTTFIYNEESGVVERQYLSLAGTYRNCAGGVTPWKSWLTCEEDVTRKGGNIMQDHGYVFEIPATDQIGLIDPVPITAMGRFNHEAVAVDPKTGIVYQTEDQGDGLFYRYIPEVAGHLHAGGRLQVLAIVDQPSFDTRNWEVRSLAIQEPMEVQWLDIDDVESPQDDLRYRGFVAGAARFARGEGIWFGENELFFACTNGGPTRYGQVFRYRTSPYEGTPGEAEAPARLELFAESPDKTVLHMCDNLTIAPWGDVLLCEDNSELNHIRGINREGKIYDFALNCGSTSEFAGLVFSPSGKTLFVNIQESGETLAITGPWERFTV